MDIEKLIWYLEVSAERNGKDKVLTIGHLLNLFKLMKKNDEIEEIGVENWLNKREKL